MYTHLVHRADTFICVVARLRQRWWERCTCYVCINMCKMVRSTGILLNVCTYCVTWDRIAYKALLAGTCMSARQLTKESLSRYKVARKR